MSLALAVRFVHLLAVVTWVGGMLFIALVLVPTTRPLEDPALRTRFHVKGVLVVLALLLGGLHDFVLGPRAGRPGADALGLGLRG